MKVEREEELSGSASCHFLHTLVLQCFRGRLCPSHQTYCLNYSAAVFYLESLRHRDDFSIYLKVKCHFL